ncbi:transcription intermediary factor 1-beta-like [Haliotis rubra]|uniref:transcription intermediary factor 1-beta-like n=1 Tax=Haliotis rubra TaxID=36100 RepID=UPI001EE5433B|nr:transcription intermediary factor 1-beta-like [Haliotis rubra]XP_046547726.1 transcription intermediary factor 1-beta-like [Haliotis rubra]XP_046547727.1 transcription intermediary factor 1-beta-like [Haliotis rubra]XP_046547728.1 transcription intermediary factor 1-beta-like [Haliotis rubra]XP_046547729.1 transcription intermediary factor 1-beta-like [Haliotis rubra]
MAHVSVSQNLREDFLTCKICLNIYDSPKILSPCLHTCCKGCIEKLIHGSQTDLILCPECQRPVKITDKNPESLQDNFYVNGLVDAFSINSCSVCKLRGSSNSASHQCLDCGDSLCNLCSAGHLASRTTVNHRVVPLQEVASGQYDNEIINKKHLYCVEHKDKECSIYCKSCSKPICVQCALIGHRDHELASVEDGSADAGEVAHNILGEGQELLRNLTVLWKKVQTDQAKVLEKQQTAVNEVEITAEEIIQNVIAQKDRAVAQLHKSYTDMGNEYAALKLEVDNAGRWARKMVDTTKVIVSQSSGAELLLLTETLKQGLLQIQDVYMTLQQKTNPLEVQISWNVDPNVHDILNRSVFVVNYGFPETTPPPGMSNYQQPHPITNSAASYASLPTDTPRSSPELVMNDPLTTAKKYISVSSSLLFKPLQSQTVASSPDDQTARLKKTLQQYKILDPPTVEPDPVVPHSEELPQGAAVAVSSSTAIQCLPGPPPRIRTYSDVLKQASVAVVPFKQKSHSTSVRLQWISNLNVSVKKDSSETEILGLAFFGHDRLVLTDKGNCKVKSFLKDGTTGFVKEFSENGNSPSSIACIKDVIAFVIQNALYIVTKQYVPIAKVKLSPTDQVEDNVSYPLCLYDEESFLVSNLQANKQWVIKVSGEHIRELQCPAKSPVFSVARDSCMRYLYSSWGQPGSVVVTEPNFKRFLVLRPNTSDAATDEWYPGYAACDNAGKFYVCDTNQDQIIVFNRYGNQVMTYSTAAENLSMPLCLIIDRKDTMFVSGKNKVCQYKIKRRKPSN